MKKSLSLALLLLLSSQPKAQTTIILGKEHLEIKDKKIELRIDNHNNLKNSLGYFRLSTDPISFYFDRKGLANFKIGAERKNIYFNLDHENKTSLTEFRGTRNTRIDQNNIVDAGFDIPLYSLINLKLGVEGANKQNEIDIKRVKIGADTTFYKADHLIGSTTGGVKLSSKYFSFKYFLNNHTDFENIDETTKEGVISFTYPDYVDYTWNGNHNAYLTARNNWINIFAQFNSLDFSKLNYTGLKDNLERGKLIIGSGNYFDNEVKRYHYDLENKVRNVNRIYDLSHETEKGFLNNAFFNSGFEIIKPLRKMFNKKSFLDDLEWHNSFRTEFKMGQKPIYELNARVKFKNLKFYLNIDSENDYNIAISYQKLLAGNKKDFPYIGHIIDGK